MRTRFGIRTNDMVYINEMVEQFRFTGHYSRAIVTLVRNVFGTLLRHMQNEQVIETTQKFLVTIGTLEIVRFLFMCLSHVPLQFAIVEKSFIAQRTDFVQETLRSSSVDTGVHLKRTFARVSFIT